MHRSLPKVVAIKALYILILCMPVLNVHFFLKYVFLKTKTGSIFTIRKKPLCNRLWHFK